MDDVVARTGMTLGLVVVMASPWPGSPTCQACRIAIGAGLVAMVLALVQSFKRKAVPALILAYAALEGLFLGAISNYVDNLHRARARPCRPCWAPWRSSPRCW